MKVYFTASVSTGLIYKDQYSSIISEVEKQKHTVLSKHILTLTKPEKLAPDIIFKREKEKIDQSDCIIAEVTEPSVGVGSIIAYALTQNKPVLALFYKESENKLSPMIAGNPSFNLYLEHYDDNLHFILHHFFDHVEKNKQRRGKLIVIDGGDGSGKGTQTELLANYLKTKKIPVKVFDFPRYYTSFHGKMVGRFLAGEFGKLDDINPYLASLAYALDRASAKEEMDEWLGKGGMIICNRYATSSMAHQGARLPKDKRDEFIEWIDELEYKVHRIPREDLVIYLYVPWKVGFELTKKKEKRGYVKGLDIAEKDMKHRQDAEQSYVSLAKERKNWVTIECMKNNSLRSKEDIHKEIISILTIKNLISS
jgi:dTMP kinase